MEFKNALRQLRIEYGWTQKDVADRLGTTKAAISMYENGRREPTFETLEKLADLFNVDTDYLIGRETGSTYYLDPFAVQYAEFLRENPGHRALFDASRKVRPEDLDKAVRMLGIFAEDK